MPATQIVTKCNSNTNEESIFVQQEVKIDSDFQDLKLIDMMINGSVRIVAVISEQDYQSSKLAKFEVDCNKLDESYFQKLQQTTTIINQVKAVIASQYNQNELTDSEVVWIDSEDLLDDIEKLQKKLLSEL